MNHYTEILVELYKRGEYSALPLFDKQLIALNALENNFTTELLYGGGARSGKSWLLSFWQIMRRLAYPESAGLIARNEFSKLQQTTMLTFFKVAKWLKLVPKVDYTYNGQTHVVEFSNGSRIFFTEIKYLPSDPEFDRLGSYDLTDCCLDEAQQIHPKAVSVLKGRFSVLRGKGWRTIPKALYTCNPARNWIYSDFVKPSRENTMKLFRMFVPALVTDNPTVSKEYIENLQRADKVTVERLLNGNFDYDDDPSVLTDFDAVCDMFTNDHVQPTKDNYISTDLAMQGRDRFVVISWQGLVGTISIDINNITGKEIESKLNELKILKKVPNSSIVADSDGLGNYLSSYIKNIKEFRGGTSARDKKYFNLKSECGFKLAELINERKIKIICSPQQRELLIEECLASLKRENIDNDLMRLKLLSKSVVKDSLRRSPDLFDALLMRVYFEIYKKRHIM